MTELEQRINELREALAPSGKIANTLSGIRKTLNSSSHIVDSVTNFGDNLQENIADGVGGVTGKVGGWLVGNSTNLVGKVAGGAIVGTLKTVAGIIPDSSDLKFPEVDKKVAHCVDTYSLPVEKDKLFELLQFIAGSCDSKTSPYGKQTIQSMKNLQSRVQSAFMIATKDDTELQLLAKPYLPKKRFGIF